MKSSDMSTKVAPMRSAIPASARVTSASAPRKMRLPSTLARMSERDRGLVDAEDTAEAVADLAERDPDLDRGDEERQEIVAAARRRLERVERPPPGVAIPRGARARDPLGERGADGRVHLEEVARREVVRDELVDPDDDPGVVLDLALVAVRRILDLTLHAGNRGHRAGQIADLMDVQARRLRELARHMLGGVRAAGRRAVGGAARRPRWD